MENNFVNSCMGKSDKAVLCVHTTGLLIDQGPISESPISKLRVRTQPQACQTLNFWGLPNSEFVLSQNVLRVGWFRVTLMHGDLKSPINGTQIMWFTVKTSGKKPLSHSSLPPPPRRRKIACAYFIEKSNTVAAAKQRAYVAENCCASPCVILNWREPKKESKKWFTLSVIFYCWPVLFYMCVWATGATQQALGRKVRQNLKI